MAESEFARYPSLHDRAVVVTGGASGIGASIVTHFAEQRARVGFIDFDADAGRALMTQLGPNAARCLFVEADLRDIARLRTAMTQLAREFGRTPTVLVNNAARDDRHSIEEVTPEYWDERMATNLRHQFFSAQALIPGMVEAGGGSIINTSPVSFLLAQGGMPVYLTAKSAVIGLARDLGPHRIRVNSLTPGWVLTERQTRLWLSPEAEKRMAALDHVRAADFRNFDHAVRTGSPAVLSLGSQRYRCHAERTFKMLQTEVTSVDRIRRHKRCRRGCCRATPAIEKKTGVGIEGLGLTRSACNRGGDERVRRAVRLESLFYSASGVDLTKRGQ